MYAHAAMQQSMARICEEEGFTHVESNAMDLLALATGRYIETVGRRAQQLAELAGRGKVALADVHSAIEQCGVAFGRHASIPPRFDVEEADVGEIPEVDAPPFPMQIPSGPEPCVAFSRDVADGKSKSRGRHIPSFLPPFPMELRKEPQKPNSTGSNAAAESESSREMAMSSLLELTTPLMDSDKTNPDASTWPLAHPRQQDAEPLLDCSQARAPKRLCMHPQPGTEKNGNYGAPALDAPSKRHDATSHGSSSNGASVTVVDTVPVSGSRTESGDAAQNSNSAYIDDLLRESDIEADGPAQPAHSSAEDFDSDEDSITAQDSTTFEALTTVLCTRPFAEVRLRVKKEHASWRNRHGQSLLFWAVQRSPSMPETPEICKYLTHELGLGIDSKSGKSGCWQTPLFFAAKRGGAEAVKFLVENRANVNCTDSNHQTPLFYAASLGNLSSLEALVALGADPSAGDQRQQTPLFYAVHGCHVEACRQLVQARADPNVRDFQGQSPAALARQKESAELVALFRPPGGTRCLKLKVNR